MKNRYTNSNAAYVLACATGLVFILSACSSDDAAQVLADEFVALSGTITKNAIPAEEPGVTVKGIYSDNNPLNPETVTAANGTFSLNILKNTAVSLQAEKAGFATLNSAKESLSLDINDADFELATVVEAETMLSDAFGGGPWLSGPGQAWLAVNVLDANTGAEIPGVAITTTGTPAGVVYTNCDGTDSTDVVTVVDQPVCNRDGTMYLAYFDTDSTEVTVSDGISQQIAPVRRGQITFIEIER